MASGSLKARESATSLDRYVWLLLWEHPVASGLLALVVYVSLSIWDGAPWDIRWYAYYNYLADAFLHGQTSLRLLPGSPHDLSLFEGRYYLYWGPFPAILMMPFVLLFGVDFSDVIFTLGIAALNVAVVALMLRQARRRGVIALSRHQSGLLVLFFALGTVHVTLAPFGRVWFTGQLVGFLCVALGYLATLGLRGPAAFIFTGVALAGALLTRNHLLFAGLWPAYFLLNEHRSVGWRRLSAYMLAGLTPVVLAVGLLGWYNWARFGDVFDNGLAYHKMGEMFAANYQRYGAFHLFYLPTNLFFQYISYPFPMRYSTFFGGSLFLLSPVFFAALWALITERKRWDTWVLGGTILLVAIPILLLMGTGWVQFGPRYTLDFTVPLLLLTALGLRRWPLWLLTLLTAISILHYILGTLHLSVVI